MQLALRLSQVFNALLSAGTDRLDAFTYVVNDRGTLYLHPESHVNTLHTVMNRRMILMSCG